ncbi:NAD(P)/FAD-dependent oxidoreductase [Amphritea pacifica]|uniref:NAD(P)/FAD-dependent oxidoreductase n=1 Tax=Amphritea pacifica TaxID=2811233 RepID=A0ABS2W7Q7_9GAMM|nr:FAD-dependent oxidoreductase [Amphritea pacifica]MBN0987621.1 NAD(P)/FAD-dependent oxidoreductase [Amphritea pacifica]MBN1007466.1 NAD(P)/FAD-dependent oxidoreductase [Amphritea pacifica]
MAKAHLIIIGNGMACGRLLDEILKRDPDLYRITVFGAEGYANYNRIMLSPVLAGEIRADEIITHSEQWYQENSITLHSGDPVIAIDTATQTLTCQSGSLFSYDKLVLATGSEPVIPPAARNCDLDGILSFRNLDDIDRIMSKVSNTRHATVIGGGLLGLEAAWGLRQQGLEVTVIHRGGWLLNRQLDPAAGKMLQQSLEARGITFRLNAEISQFSGQVSSDENSAYLSGGSKSEVHPRPETLQQVTLSDDSVIHTGLAVIAIGITPNHKLAKVSGIDCDKGVLVNDRLQSSHPNVYALGECTQFGSHTFGLVAPLWDQATVLADQLCRTSDSLFRVQPCATKLKVSGIDLFSAGEFLDSPESESVICQDLTSGTYRKLIFRDQRLTGAVLYGAVNDGNWYFELIQTQQQVEHLTPDLIFGRRYCEAESIPQLTPVGVEEIRTSAPELCLATGATS